MFVSVWVYVHGCVVVTEETGRVYNLLELTLQALVSHLNVGAGIWTDS